MSNIVFVIDAQEDFCSPDGSLYVPGADQDMSRAAAWIRANSDRIDAVAATLDSHHQADIAHPLWWIDPFGNRPHPFLTISSSDLASGRFRPIRPEMAGPSREYIEYLEQAGKKSLVVWPPHCLLGHPGHNVYAPLRQALDSWERERVALVDYYLKGLNPLTEHYSAIRAEKVDPADPSTDINWPLIHRLDQFDHIIVFGEAQSHCVADTLTDLITHLAPAKLVILEDAMSNVESFESQGADFLRSIREEGAKITNTNDFQL